MGDNMKNVFGRLSHISLMLPLLMIALTFLASLSVGVVGYFNGKAGLYDAVKNELKSQSKSRSQLLTLKLENALADLDALANSDMGLLLAQAALPKPVEGKLREKDYFTASGSAADRMKLDGSALKTAYSFLHMEAHPVFKARLMNGGYGDIYVLNLRGDVVYSVTKSGDFLLSTSEDKLSRSPLADLFTRLSHAAEGAQAISDFLLYSFSEERPAVFLAQPVFELKGPNQRGFAGMIAMRLDVDFFNSVLSDRQDMGDTGQVFLAGADGRAFSDLPLSEEPTALREIRPYNVVASAESGEDFGIETSKSDGDMMVAVQPLHILGKNWYVIAERTAYESLASVRKMATGMFFGTLIVLITATGIAILFARHITRPLTQLSGIMEKLADGCTDVDLPDRGGTDELSLMTSTVGVFRDNAVERERLAAVQKRENDERDARVARLETLIGHFEAAVSQALGNLDQANGQLMQISRAVESASDDVSGQAQSAGASVLIASENVASAASSTEELVTSINEISQRAARSTEVAQLAVSSTSGTFQTMRDLSSAADRIGEVIGLIRDIASQTNLLALNATIEAARAGEVGKGFAVVAAEVKQLAEQTSKATEDITGQIEAIQTSSGTAVKSIEDVTNIVNDMEGLASSVASAVIQQDAAVQMIAENVSQASARAEDGAQRMTSVGNAASHAKATGADLENLSQMLVEQGRLIRQEVSDFLEGVRAA